MYYTKGKVQVSNRIVLPADAVQNMKVNVGDDVWIGVNEQSKTFTLQFQSPTTITSTNVGGVYDAALSNCNFVSLNNDISEIKSELKSIKTMSCSMRGENYGRSKNYKTNK